MYAGKRLTSQLIGVFDAGSCCLFHDYFALVWLEQVFESPSFLGDAQIQPPQEGLRGRRQVRWNGMDSHGGLEVTIRQTESKKKLPNNFVKQTPKCS